METYKMKYNLSIDVGINALGFSVWDLKNWNKLVKPTESGVISVPSNLMIKYANDWPSKVLYLICRLETDIYESYNIETQFTEWPQNRDGAVGAAATKLGNVSQLAYACGLHAGKGLSYGIETKLVPVAEWKGSLPKQVVINRIYNAIGIKYKSHDADSTGIGLHCKGFHLNHKCFGSM